MKRLPTIDLLDLFPNFNITVTPYSFLEGTSTVLDLALLNALANKYTNCKYLEIGTWRGESIANVSRFADKCVSICFSKEEMKTLKLPDAFIKACGFFSDTLNIERIRHNSHTFDYTLLKDKFDLIFVDGDHRYAAVKLDTQNVFKILKDDNSVIVWHDYGTSPEKVRPEVLNGIIDGCPEAYKKHLYHVSNTLCAIFIKSKFNTTFTKFPQTPNKKFKITISAEKI